MDLDLTRAPGRHPTRLSDRWHLVTLDLAPGVVVVGLFLDGNLVELIDEPLDVAGYLHTCPLRAA